MPYLENGLGVCQGHWKYHRSIEHIRFPIDVLTVTMAQPCVVSDIQCRKM